MDKIQEKTFNDIETRLIHRFNEMIRRAEKKEKLENARIEKLIDVKIELALQKISNKIDAFIKLADKKKL